MVQILCSTFDTMFSTSFLTSKQLMEISTNSLEHRFEYASLFTFSAFLSVEPNPQILLLPQVNNGLQFTALGA